MKPLRKACIQKRIPHFFLPKVKTRYTKVNHILFHRTNIHFKEKMVLSSINNIPSHPNFSNKENAMKNSNKKMSKPVVTGTSSSSNDNEQENRGDIQNYSTRLPLSSSSSNIKKHQTKNASEILLSSLLLPSLVSKEIIQHS